LTALLLIVPLLHDASTPQATATRIFRMRE
jgi:hypothetical protein